MSNRLSQKNSNHEEVEALLNSSQRSFAVSLRLTPEDVLYFKKVAKVEGIPYLTCMSSSLHKIVSGKYIDADLAKNKSKQYK